LRELADSLLDLSRVEAAGQASFVAVNLNDLLRDLSEPYASQADQAGLTLSLEMPQYPIEIRGDPAQLRRAIGNLVDNAIKFTPEGGTITIELTQNAEAIELCVQDTASVFPKKIAADVQPFSSRTQRGELSRQRAGTGHRQGHCRSARGSVNAANTSPGARFCIRLPEAR
jgi:signal transduction histidine kinase